MNAASPSSQRGLVLLEQRRYAEAEKYFRESLAGDPQDAFALFHLAVCQSNQDHNTDALASVEQALRLEPEIADFFALRALILA